MRQRGTRFRPGDGIGIGRDDTLYAIAPGKLVFGMKRGKRVVSVAPHDGSA